MLEIGASELLVIAVVAIVVIAPKDLPRFLRTVGGYVGKVRRMARDFQMQVNDAVRDDELDGLRRQVTDLSKGVETDMGRALAPAPDRYAPRRLPAALPVPTAADAPLDAAVGHPRMTPLPAATVAASDRPALAAGSPAPASPPAEASA